MDSPPPSPGPRKQRASLQDTISAPLYTPAPEPPFTFAMHDVVYMSFAIDGAAMAPFLPPSLRMVSPALAQVAVGRMGAGWGLTNNTFVFPCVVIEDFPSPDTAEAAFLPTGLSSSAGAALISRHFAAHEEGTCTTQVDTTGISFSASRAERPLLEGRAIFAGEPEDQVASIDRYLGVNDQGVLVSSLISLAGRSRAMRLERLEIAPDAPPVWQALRPLALHWAVHFPEVMGNWSVPEPVQRDGSASIRQVMLDTLGSRGRACAVLGPDGAVLQANAQGRRLMAAAGLGGGPLRLPGRAAQQALDRALASPSGGQVLLPRPDGAPPLVVHLTRLDAAIAGPGACLALFIDPATSRADANTDLLQLLGLTPAEARVAAAVGAGLPPREAALRLQVTESTVRSTLKVVFDKLALSRQVDLVQLVARLSG